LVPYTVPRERESESESENESFRDFNQIPRPPPTRIVLMFKPVQEIPTDQNPLSILVKMTPRHSSKTQCSLFLEVHTFEAGSFYFIWVFRYVGF
jgi:hypothetical protein